MYDETVNAMFSFWFGPNSRVPTRTATRHLGLKDQ